MAQRPRLLPPILLIGCLSMLFAEIFSGASQAWFINGWGLLMTFPLYLSHVLFLLGLALKFKRTTLPQLYLLGAVFGLYESWITKVLWVGYASESGPGAGTIAGLGVAEFPILVFFWHPVMSFIAPILVFEILTGQALQSHVHILQKSTKKTRTVVVFFALVSTFVALGNGFNLVLANLSLIGTLLLIVGLHARAKGSALTALALGKTGARRVAAYLVLLYVGSFFVLMPENLPRTALPYLSIIAFYVFLGVMLRRSRPVEDALIPLDETAYSLRDLRRLAGITVVAVNVAVLIAPISAVVMALTYVGLVGGGTVLFVAVVFRTLRGDLPRAESAAQELPI